MSCLRTVTLLSALTTTAAAHGYVQGIVADGVWYEGYNPSFQYQDPAPAVIRWSDPEDQSNGYIAPNDYSSADIICHLGATPGGTAATVKAGGTVELQWTAWPDSHHGPVLSYLAKAGDTSTSVDKTTLEFVKIDAAGLIDDTSAPGTWASDQLIANNNSWALEIPSTIAPGMYVLRHEIIALHSAGESDGAQNYPQCINLKVIGTGTANPSGTLGEKLYTNTAAPGIVVNIYSLLSTYEIPGPTLWSGATATLSQSSVAITGAAAGSSGSSTSWLASTSAGTTASTPPASTAVATSSVVQATSTAMASTAARSTNNNYAETSTSVDIDIASTQVSQATTTTAAASSMPTSAVSLAASMNATEIFSQNIGTTLPTATAGSSGNFGDAPSKALPAGFTVRDLLLWVDYMIEKGFSEGHHQRDFVARNSMNEETSPDG